MSNSLENLTEHLNKWQLFKDILSSLRNNERIWIQGVYQTGFSFLLAGIKKKLKTAILVVLPNEEEAQTLFADLKEFSPEEVCYFPSSDFSLKTSDIVYEETLNERVTNLYELSRGNSHPLVIIPLRAFLQRMISPSYFVSSIIHLKIGDSRRGDLTKKLDRLGYERKDIVEDRGYWALRGSILDIFPHLYDDPLRIEFLEERIESIRHFDPTTQKSTVKLKEAIILPRGDVFSEERNSTILSYLPKDTLVCLKDSMELEEKSNKLWEGEEYEKFFETHFFKWTKMRKELSSKNLFFVSEIPQKPIGEYSRIFSLPFQSLEGIGVSFDRVEERVREWQKDEFNIYFVSYNEGEKERLKEILKGKGLYPHK